MRVSHKALGIFLLAFLPATLAAQNFVYTNDDNPAANGNTVSIFSVAANGVLGPNSSCTSPVVGTGGTGGAGGFYASSRIIVVGNYLYAANAGSNNISGFTVNPTTGCLTSMGSPFATQGTAGNDGMSLAATPNGTYLYAGSAESQDITIFSIGSGGALSPLASPSSPVSLDGEPAGMKVSPDGGYLVVALPSKPGPSGGVVLVNEIAVFSIDSTSGALTPVTGSPFTSGGPDASGVDINCSSNLLFVGNSVLGTGKVDVFNFPPSGGSMAEITGSPFSTASAVNSSVVALSPDGSELFVSNQNSNSITAFTVGADGSLSSGSVFTDGVGMLPGGLATDQAGSFLYSANRTGSTVSSLNIGAGGALSTTSGSPFADLNSTALESLAAYPAATCSGTTPTTVTGSFSAKLRISPAGFDLMGTFTPGEGGTLDPLTTPVSVQVGPSFSFTIPAGSFRQLGAEAGAGVYVFSGTAGGVPVQARIQVLPTGNTLIKVDASATDLSSLANPVGVTLTIGNNTGATDVTALFVRGGP